MYPSRRVRYRLRRLIVDCGRFCVFPVPQFCDRTVLNNPVGFQCVESLSGRVRFAPFNAHDVVHPLLFGSRRDAAVFAAVGPLGPAGLSLSFLSLLWKVLLERSLISSPFTGHRVVSDPYLVAPLFPLRLIRLLPQYREVPLGFIESNISLLSLRLELLYVPNKSILRESRSTTVQFRNKRL